MRVATSAAMASPAPVGVERRAGRQGAGSTGSAESGSAQSGSAQSGSARGGAAPTGSDKLRFSLAGLEGIGLDQLRAEWRRVHRTPAPGRLSRDLLVRGVAYKLQESAIGGLSPATRRKLIGASEGRTKTPPLAETTRLRPGTMLVREWHGRGHTVLVQERGFELEGRHYASLSEIARHITGAHWSGPRFFGLNRPIRSSRVLAPDGDGGSRSAEAVAAAAVGPATAASEPAHA